MTYRFWKYCFPFCENQESLTSIFWRTENFNYFVVVFNNYSLLGIVFVVSNPNSQEFYLIFSLEVMKFYFLFWIMVSFKLKFFNVRWETTQSNFLACADTIIPAPFVKKGKKKRPILHWIVFLYWSEIGWLHMFKSISRHYFSFDILDAKHLSLCHYSTSWFFYWDYNNIVDFEKLTLILINVINLDIDIEIYPQNWYISLFT